MHDERDDEATGFDSLADATGTDRRNEQELMRSGRDVSDEAAEDDAGGDEKTAIEGAGGLGATHRTWGATPTGVEGGAGTHVPAEGDEDMDPAEERDDSSDPRGY